MDPLTELFKIQLDKYAYWLYKPDGTSAIYY